MNLGQGFYSQKALFMKRWREMGQADRGTPARKHRIVDRDELKRGWSAHEKEHIHPRRLRPA